MGMQPPTCLVLMFKSPRRSKQRLAAEIGARAHTAAEHLLECALADIAAWSGPTCLAPADPPDMQYARERGCRADLHIEQGGGNLGERIANVNSALLDAGHTRQLFIGIDCPALDIEYLSRAAELLHETDVVLGPADDGGVVLMGIRGRWPPLGSLPWSTDALRTELILACEKARLGVALLESRTDVDAAHDLRSLVYRLAQDRRPSRRRLCEWVQSESLV